MSLSTLKNLMFTTILALVFLPLSACSFMQTQSEDEENPAVEIQSENEQDILTSASNKTKADRHLWIWIAPQYRKDLPENTGEYLIESI